MASRFAPRTLGASESTINLGPLRYRSAVCSISWRRPPRAVGVRMSAASRSCRFLCARVLPHVLVCICLRTFRKKSFLVFRIEYPFAFTSFQRWYAGYRKLVVHQSSRLGPPALAVCEESTKLVGSLCCVCNELPQYTRAARFCGFSLVRCFFNCLLCF